MVNVISQHVDTLKCHYYTTFAMDEANMSKYNNLLNSVVNLKKQAQLKNNDLETIRDINLVIGVNKFNVMSKSVKGFSAVIHNFDVSIAMRKITDLKSHNPILKVEFRAEFLARYGYVKCLKIVNSMISNYIMSDYKINISEIHLATDIQGYDFGFYDFFRLKSRSRLSQTYEEAPDDGVRFTSFGTLTNFTGFHYGSGNYMLRLYNKTKEINKFKDKAFAKDLLWLKNSNYDETKTVWRIEVQLRREKLKNMTDCNYDKLDGYEIILNNIPSIWSKAVKDFKMLDVSFDTISELLKGYRTFKNGKIRPVTKHTIYQIFKRANLHPAWNSIQTFNSYKPDEIYTAFKVPNLGSMVFVQNSIKSLFSTMGRYYGSINIDTMKKAFKDSNDLNKRYKGISLVDDAINKHIDYFERTEFVRLSGTLNIPDYKDLLNDLVNVVDNSAKHLYLDEISPSTSDRLISIVNQNLNSINLFDKGGDFHH